MDNDIIELLISEWLSFVVFVCKKNGDYRFVVDYWKLNLVIKLMNFLLLCMEDIIDILGESNV